MPLTIILLRGLITIVLRCRPDHWLGACTMDSELHCQQARQIRQSWSMVSQSQARPMGSASAHAARLATASSTICHHFDRGICHHVDSRPCLLVPHAFFAPSLCGPEVLFPTRPPCFGACHLVPGPLCHKPRLGLCHRLMQLRSCPHLVGRQPDPPLPPHSAQRFDPGAQAHIIVVAGLDACNGCCCCTWCFVRREQLDGSH